MDIATQNKILSVDHGYIRINEEDGSATAYFGRWRLQQTPEGVTVTRRTIRRRGAAAVAPVRTLHNFVAAVSYVLRCQKET